MYMTHLFTLISTLVLLLVFDGIYFYLFNELLTNQVKSVQKSPLQLNVLGAALCYVWIAVGLYYFIIYQERSVMDAFFLGVFVYGVYELTTYAIFKKWKPQMVAMDTLWGGIMFSAITYILYNAPRKIFR